MGDLVAAAMREMGVGLYLAETVAGFEAQDGRVRAVATGERTLPADLVVLGLGVRPDSGLAERAGIAVGETTGGIVVDDRMRTSAGTCGPQANVSRPITGTSEGFLRARPRLWWSTRDLVEWAPRCRPNARANAHRAHLRQGQCACRSTPRYDQ